LVFRTRRTRLVYGTIKEFVNMAHDDRHKGLLACLVLGELSDAETNEVAALLETCAECPKDLAHFQRTLGPEHETSARVQLGVLIAGFYQDIEEELRALAALAPAMLATQRYAVSSGASGDAEEAIVFVVNDEEREALVRLLEAYLASRRSDTERLRLTHISVGVMVETTESGKVLSVQTAVGEERLGKVDLSRFIQPHP
jgi:anti-sigma factor RsiW